MASPIILHRGRGLLGLGICPFLHPEGNDLQKRDKICSHFFSVHHSHLCLDCSMELRHLLPSLLLLMPRNLVVVSLAKDTGSEVSSLQNSILRAFLVQVVPLLMPSCGAKPLSGLDPFRGRPARNTRIEWCISGVILTKPLELHWCERRISVGMC
ncbi:hypothetical protein Y1Q_0005735 [Alligator mississippiensis]|uniref:Uncharacterized protein n=1 Tax=Alligator mississippiensis TaxID=8496 RepID=A0A151MFP0_ALLMI|nr:hypothetical protein Y1Q_0005735 [Alligator mississippiensis]